MGLRAELTLGTVDRVGHTRYMQEYAGSLMKAKIVVGKHLT